MATRMIGFGALNVDHVYVVERILADGEAPVLRHSVAPGGSAANTIYALAKLGLETGFIGAVGDDQSGKMLLQDFESVGVDTSHIRLTEAETGATLCLTDRGGERAIYVLPGANSLLAHEDTDQDYVKQAELVHLSSFVDSRQLELQQRLVQGLPPSVRVSFAPGAIYAARGLEALRPVIERTHVLFANRQEIEDLTGEDFKQGARSLLAVGCRTVAVTLGRGLERDTTSAVSYVLSHDAESTIEVRNTGRVPGDTIGAGDAFAAGFLFGLLQNQDIETCGYWGDRIARFSVSRVGAREGLPTLADFTRQNPPTA